VVREATTWIASVTCLDVIRLRLRLHKACVSRVRTNKACNFLFFNTLRCRLFRYLKDVGSFYLTICTCENIQRTFVAIFYADMIFLPAVDLYEITASSVLCYIGIYWQ